MIRHYVFVKFRNDVSDGDKQAAFRALANLTQTIPEIRAASFGTNLSPEGLTQGYEDGFAMDFDDLAARDAYLIHPDHRKAGAEMVALVEGGRDGVFVFDMEI